ncbi:hypothetical protein DJ030_03380 [bacterium endosymbiont of Escarpia laminata]|nr:MAG: hypothetical protein DJ030_03380 [bacterium endosymbiont of Escarpia laminata]
MQARSDSHKKREVVIPLIGDLTGTHFKAEFNCSNQKLWDLINTGEIEAYYVGRMIRIRRESIEAYKERHRVPMKAKRAV